MPQLNERVVNLVGPVLIIVRNLQTAAGIFSTFGCHGNENACISIY